MECYFLQWWTEFFKEMYEHDDVATSCNSNMKSFDVADGEIGMKEVPEGRVQVSDVIKEREQVELVSRWSNTMDFRRFLIFFIHIYLRFLFESA